MINKHFFFDENNKKTPKSTSKHKVAFFIPKLVSLNRDVT